MNSTLLWFVVLYWVISVGIGLWAATRVHTTKDFAVAGRHLPFYMVTATVFATWFGSETVLGIPATFLQENLHGVVADPFGSSLCLILVGLFSAAPLYRMNLLTIGDFYKKRFGRSVEVLTTIAIVISYLGWVGAQITALGLVFNVVSGGETSKLTGMWIGSSTILIYTLFGGMWAVAITDFLQMIVIVVGMLWIGGEISSQVGGVSAVVRHAAAAGKFNFWPALDLKEMIGFAAAWITMMLGSIPQQDVFQRVQSSKSEKIAVWGSVLGGSLYFVFAFVPMFLAYSATLIDPSLVKSLIDTDSQMILPRLVINHAPMFAQVMFFGALLSKASIFKMVENAYQITLVMAFVPLAFGVYWKRATNQGALLSIFLGLSTWLAVLVAGTEDPFIPAKFAGLLMSLLGMFAGSLLPQWVAHPLPERDLHAALHHRAAAHTQHDGLDAPSSSMSLC